MSALDPGKKGCLVDGPQQAPPGVPLLLQLWVHQSTHPVSTAPSFRSPQGLPKPDVRRQAGELLESVKLTGAAKQRTAAYSGGMRRRLRWGSGRAAGLCTDLILPVQHVEPAVCVFDRGVAASRPWPAPAALQCGAGNAG